MRSPGLGFIGLVIVEELQFKKCCGKDKREGTL
jgi:hypothetical protein